MTHAERTQAAIRERIAELQEAQLNRAFKIEDALKTYEARGIRIRSASEYIALSEHQRRIVGVPEKVELNVVDRSKEHERYEKEAARRLKKIREGK